MLTSTSPGNSRESAPHFSDPRGASFPKNPDSWLGKMKCQVCLYVLQGNRGFEMTYLVCSSDRLSGLEPSVQFSCSVVSNSLRPHGLQDARLPCPSLSPAVCSNSCPFESATPSNLLILCCPLLLIPSIFPTIRVFCFLFFPNESALHSRWPKYWNDYRE